MDNICYCLDVGGNKKKKKMEQGGMEFIESLKCQGITLAYKKRTGNKKNLLRYFYYFSIYSLSTSPITKVRKSSPDYVRRAEGSLSYPLLINLIFQIMGFFSKPSTPM